MSHRGPLTSGSGLPGKTKRPVPLKIRRGERSGAVERESAAYEGRQQARCAFAGQESSAPVGAVDPADLAHALDAWIAQRLRALRERAEQERRVFERRLREAGQDQPRSAWGRIAVRIREQRGARATPGAFSIEWATYRYGNTASGRIYLSDYIRKGAGDRYPTSALRGAVRAWQWPLVDDAERAFSRIRAAARQIAQVRTQFRAAAKLCEEYHDGTGAD